MLDRLPRAYDAAGMFQMKAHPLIGVILLALAPACSAGGGSSADAARSALPAPAPPVASASALPAVERAAAPLRALQPDSDAHAVIDPDRDVYLRLPDGTRIQVSDLPGPEDGEAVSPDGQWVAFLGGATGIASVYAAPIPRPGEKPRPALQLTNVGLERQPKTPGRMPEGFVPPPDKGPLYWADARTVAWTAAGIEYRAELPR
jgi:hypothetical protein